MSVLNGYVGKPFGQQPASVCESGIKIESAAAGRDVDACRARPNAAVGDDVTSHSRDLLATLCCCDQLSMGRNRRDGESGPLTLGQALAARVRLIVWCKACRRRVEPDIEGLARRHGAATSVIDWAARLRCSACGGAADFVVTGEQR